MKTNENALTANLREIFSRTHNGETIYGIGDDAAVLKANGIVESDPRFVISTDILVEDVHFKLEYSTPDDIAKRAFAQNLADVAAMGARGTSMVVTLILPKTLDEDWIYRFASAFAKEAIDKKVAVVGGDLSSGKNIAVSVTVLGALDGRKPVLRSGARPGDTVAIAGELGLSALGFELILKGEAMSNPKAVKRYLAPSPPFEAGVVAAKCGASSMIDISDGLIVDAERIANASGVTLSLTPTPIQKGSIGDNYFYFGGEDHALLATFPPGIKPPPQFFSIGIVLERQDVPIICPDINNLRNIKGWDHFDV